MVGALVMESSGDGGGAHAGGEGESERCKPASLSWLSVKAWDQLMAYEATLGKPFAGLPDAIESAPDVWKVRSF